MNLKKLLPCLSSEKKLMLVVENSYPKNNPSYMQIVFYDYINKLDEVLFIKDYNNYKIKFYNLDIEISGITSDSEEEQEENIMLVILNRDKISMSKRLLDGLRSCIISRGVLNLDTSLSKNIFSLALVLSHYYDIDFINDRQIKFIVESYDEERHLRKLYYQYIKNQADYIMKLDRINEVDEMKSKYMIKHSNEIICEKIFNEYKRLQSIKKNINKEFLFAEKRNILMLENRINKGK